MENIFHHDLRDREVADMEGFTIRNDVNMTDNPVGFCFRRKDQLSADAIWAVFVKVIQSNARFGSLDTLVVTVHSVRMPVGFGGDGRNSKGRPLKAMVQLKLSIIEVKADNDCLAHAIIVAKERVENDPDYKAYRQGLMIKPVVDSLLQTTGMELVDVGGARKS